MIYHVPGDQMGSILMHGETKKWRTGFIRRHFGILEGHILLYMKQAEKYAVDINALFSTLLTA